MIFIMGLNLSCFFLGSPSALVWGWCTSCGWWWGGRIYSSCVGNSGYPRGPLYVSFPGDDIWNQMGLFIDNVPSIWDQCYGRICHLSSWLPWLDGRQGAEHLWHKFRWNDSARSVNPWYIRGALHNEQIICRTCIPNTKPHFIAPFSSDNSRRAYMEQWFSPLCVLPCSLVRIVWKLNTIPVERALRSH